MHAVFLYENRCRKEEESEFDGSINLPSMIKKILERHKRRTVRYYIVFSKKEKKLLKKIIVTLYGVKYNNEIDFFEFFKDYIKYFNVDALLYTCYVPMGTSGETYPYSPKVRELIEKGKYSLAMKVTRS